MSDPDNKKSRRALKSLPPDRFQPKMLIFWLVLVAAVLALLYNTSGITPTSETLTIQDVVERAEANNINRDQNKPSVIRPDPSGGRDWVVIIGESRRDANAPFKPFRAAGRLTDASMMRLQQSKLFVEQPTQTLLTAIAAQVIPFVIIIGLLYFLFVRQLRQAGRGALSFGKSRAKLLTRDRDKITFAEVAGCDEAKEEVSEVVEFLKDPKKFAENYRVYFRSTTPVEDHIEYFYADDKLLADAGIDKLPSNHRIVYPQRTTKWNSWRLGLRDYAQLLFR